jgi:hypothetical protein
MTIASPQTISLGPAGLTVPALGVGTWAWGDSLFWDYGKAYGEGDLQAAFEAGLEAGSDPVRHRRNLRVWPVRALDRTVHADPA